MSDQDDPTIRDLLGDDGEPIPASERPAKRRRTLPEALRKAMWPKGVSGNPGGRPRGITKRLRQVLAEDLGDGTTLTDLVVKRDLECALHPKHPDRQALIDLINRIDGKPTMTVQVNEGPPYRVYDATCDPRLALEAGDEDERGIKGYASNASPDLL